MKEKLDIDLNLITNVTFASIDFKDWPDLTDSYILHAQYKDRYLSEEEITYIEEHYPEWVYEKLMDYIT